MRAKKIFIIRHMSIHSSRGVSLLELIIYIGIVSFIMIIVSAAFISITTSSRNVELRAGVNSSMRFAMDKMVKDVQSASTLNVPATMNATSSTLSLVISGNTILYDVSSGGLRRSVNATPAIITPSTVRVNAIEFRRIENYNTVRLATTTSVHMTMTLGTNTQVGSFGYTETVTTTATMR